MHRPRRDAALPTATAVAMTEQKYDYDDVGQEGTVDVDSDTESLDNPLYRWEVPMPAQAPVPEKFATSSTRRRPAARPTELSLPSKMYDLDGDGVLDPVERCMRDRDGSGRGFLTNDEIYGIVREQLSAQKSAGHMRRLVAGLVCFVALLASSNLATSWASASLARDLTADDGRGEDDGKAPPPVVRIASTGQIASAQTVADVYDAVEMTDDQLERRRRLVLSEIEEDPHSHAHRRNLLACRACRARDCRCDFGAQTITFDSSIVPEEEFDFIEEDCARQKNVYIRRRWGEGGRRNSRNEAVCSRGTSVTVKMKKGGKKRKKQEKGVEKMNEKNKKDGNEGEKKNRGEKKKKRRRNRDREVIIEREDGRTLHADCRDGLCYCGGTILQGTQGDDCRIGADECQKGYVCRPENKKLRNVARYGTCARASVDMTDVVPQRNAPAGAYCNYAKGWNACVDGYHCLVNEDDDWHRYDDGPLGDFGLQIIEDRSGRRDRRGGGGRNNYGDCTDDRDGCAPGYGCVRSPGSDGGSGDDDQWSCMFGATDDMELRSSPSSSGGMVGTCFATVGFGQTCRSDYECGRDGYCDAGIVRSRDRGGASRGICAPSMALNGGG